MFLLIVLMLTVFCVATMPLASAAFITHDVTLAPSSLTILDLGQSQLVTATQHGYINPSYSWSIPAEDSCPGFTSDPGTASFTYLPTSNTLGCAFAVNVVENALVSVTGTLAVDSGQEITLNAIVSNNGISTISFYHWGDVSNGNALVGTSPTLTLTAGAAGTYNYDVIVGASNNGIIVSNTVSVTVNALPSVTLSPSSNTITDTQSVTFTNSTLYGTPPYSWSYTVLDHGSANAISAGEASISGNTITFLAGADANSPYTVWETVTDLVGGIAVSSNSAITVSNALFIDNNPVASNSFIIEYGEGISVLTDNGASGGLAPYSYQWLAADSNTLGVFSPSEANTLCSPANTLTCTFSFPGSLPDENFYDNYYFKIRATDSLGQTATSTGNALVEVGAT